MDSTAEQKWLKEESVNVNLDQQKWSNLNHREKILEKKMIHPLPMELCKMPKV